MMIPLQLMSVIALCLVAIGCGRNQEHVGKQRIVGTATWNGTPIQEGTVSLLAADSQIDSAPIENGRFTIFTTPGLKVVSVMAEREIGTPRPTAHEPNPSPVRFQYLPKECNVDSKLQETVSSETHSLQLELSGTEKKPPQI